MGPWLAVLLVLAAPPERLLSAGAPDTAENRYRIGRELYRAGEYDAAAREFLVVLELMPDSARITFNVARSLERAGRHDEAPPGYRRYLELAPDAEDRAEVEGIVRALERLLAGQEGRLEIEAAPPATVFVDDRARGTTPVTISREKRCPRGSAGRWSARGAPACSPACSLRPRPRRRWRTPRAPARPTAPYAIASRVISTRRTPRCGSPSRSGRR